MMLAGLIVAGLLCSAGWVTIRRSASANRRCYRLPVLKSIPIVMKWSAR